jgi:hypothetical protein
MADRVQFILDKMAPLFKEMERLEVFSKVRLLSLYFLPLTPPPYPLSGRGEGNH